MSDQNLVPRIQTREEATLRGLFKNIVTKVEKVDGNNQVKLSLPMIYDIRRRYITPSCQGIILSPIEVVGSDLDASYSDLFKKVCGTSTNMNFGVGYVHVLLQYKPKCGQDPKRIEIGKVYESIEPSDRRHNHKDPKLADLKMMVINETTTNVFRPTFDQMHAHLYIG